MPKLKMRVETHTFKKGQKLHLDSIYNIRHARHHHPHRNFLNETRRAHLNFPMKKATKVENDLINLCNHNVSSESKVFALRKHVEIAVAKAIAKERRVILSYR